MSSLVIKKLSPTAGKNKVEIDVHELQSRLKSIVAKTDIELIKLAIHTMLEEIADSYK